MTNAQILSLVVSNFAILLLLMTALWAFSVRIKDASIVDIAWGPACAFPAILTYLRVDGADPRATLLTVLVSLWAGRLALYLGKRNIGHGEDFRYVKMRERQGSDAAFARWSLIYVYGLQASIAWFVSLPTQIGQLGADGSIGFLGYLGVLIFTVGLIFEAVGDWQLREFKADTANKGKLMTRGLWGLTRHPNYFGDAAIWTGLTLIALEAPLGWITILSPLLMIHFLYNVSGKAMLERAMEKKYPEYAAYKKEVSGFFPLPRKRA